MSAIKYYTDTYAIFLCSFRFAFIHCQAAYTDYIYLFRSFNCPPASVKDVVDYLVIIVNNTCDPRLINWGEGKKLLGSLGTLKRMHEVDPKSLSRMYKAYMTINFMEYFWTDFSYFHMQHLIF